MATLEPLLLDVLLELELLLDVLLEVELLLLLDVLLEFELLLLLDVLLPFEPESLPPLQDVSAATSSNEASEPTRRPILEWLQIMKKRPRLCVLLLP